MAKVDLKKLFKLAKLSKNKKFGLHYAETTYKNFLPAMPHDKGNYDDVKFEAWKYTHVQEYSVYVYYKNANYRKDHHPYATARYIQNYGEVANPKIVEEMQSYLDEKIREER